VGVVSAETPDPLEALPLPLEAEELDWEEPVREGVRFK
jgi:hypothetical protein